MQYIRFIAAIFSFYFYSIETVQIPCNVEALEWNNEMKLTLFEGNAFWTKIYKYNYLSGEAYPILDCFESGLLLVRTRFKLENGNLIANGYAMNDGKYDSDPNDVLQIKCEFIMDEEKVIFKYKTEYKSRTIKWNNEKNEYDATDNFGLEEGDETAGLALVYNDGNGLFRIFQTCDGKSTWVQVEDSVLQRSNFQNELNDINKIIQDKISEMKIQGDKYDIIGLRDSIDFKREFNQVDLAAKFVENNSSD